MAPTYSSFPILGNHEIIACLGELDIPLTEQDLLKPHSDTLYRAYEEMVVLLCGESREAMYAPELDAADVLEFPELYEEAIGNLKFTRRLFDLMRRCGVPDFTLRDLTKPEYTRTRRNVSAVINFAKFREEKVAQYEATQGESVAMEQRYRAAQRKNAELKAQIARLERAKDSEKDSEEETKAAVAALRLELADGQKSRRLRGDQKSRSGGLRSARRARGGGGEVLCGARVRGGGARRVGGEDRARGPGAHGDAQGADAEVRGGAAGVGRSHRGDARDGGARGGCEGAGAGHREDRGVHGGGCGGAQEEEGSVHEAEGGEEEARRDGGAAVRD